MADTDPVTVRLRAYSGMPDDPIFVLDGAASSELRSRVAASVGSSPAGEFPVGSRYNGFSFALPEAYEVFRRVLDQITTVDRRSWNDVSGIEVFLIAEARARGYGPLLDRIRAS